MSSSDSETLGAIVVGKNSVTRPPSTSKEANTKPGEKLCSGCRATQPFDRFWGTQRNEGKEMRTCLTCRSRNSSDTPSRSSAAGTPVRKRSVAASPNVESTTRNSRLRRRQSTLDSVTHGGTPTNNSSPATYATKTRAPVLRKSFAVAPAAQEIPAREVKNKDDDTDTDEEGYFDKRQSTLPHSTSEDMDHEDAIQVQLPQHKRQRMNGLIVTPMKLDIDAEVVDEVEEGEQLLNSNGNPVGSDLAAFATSLGRLSQLLATAGKNLDNERIGALENEIHHDWRVDEMATFVEGFLKGASANSVAKGW